jgi:hypothetical protein
MAVNTTLVCLLTPTLPPLQHSHLPSYMAILAKQLKEEMDYLLSRHCEIRDTVALHIDRNLAAVIACARGTFPIALRDIILVPCMIISSVGACHRRAQAQMYNIVYI